MRKLLCNDCGSPEKIKPYLDELGFAKRTGYGKVKTPEPEQRQVAFSSPGTETLIQKLDQRHYNCDLCGAPIKPGDAAVALTMWREGHDPQPYWEAGYMDLNSTTEVTEKGTVGIDYAARER